MLGPADGQILKSGSSVWSLPAKKRGNLVLVDLCYPEKSERFGREITLAHAEKLVDKAEGGRILAAPPRYTLQERRDG